jgi:peptidoglycan/LPS O-acetylase OafA/YrhL
MNEIQISKETSNLIKGAACLLIVAHHFCSWLDGKGYNGFLIDFIGSRGGVLGVTIFFFLSAWGLSESQNKNSISIYTFCKKETFKDIYPINNY